MTTPIAGLPEIAESQANKALTHNTALRQIEINLGGVVTRNLASPPGSVPEGGLYIPAMNASGAWSGLTNKIVQRLSNGWLVIEPFEYQRLFVVDEEIYVMYRDGEWDGIGGDMLREVYDTDEDGIVDLAEVALTAQQVSGSPSPGFYYGTPVNGTAKGFYSLATINAVIPTLSITTDKIADLAVTTEKLASGSVSLQKISASGTPNSATYLRGDWSWASIPTLADGDKGDITVSSSGAIWSIDNGVINTAKLADNSVTTGKIADNSVTIAKLNATGTANSTTYLRGDGLWATVSGGTPVTDGDKGDITVSSSGATWTIDPDAVTFPKIQNVSTNRLLGRSSSGSGDIEELQIGSGLSLSGGTLSASGGGGGSAITVQDEGSSLTTALSSVNFTGAGVTATNSGNAVTVNIPGGGGGGSSLDLEQIHAIISSAL